MHADAAADLYVSMLQVPSAPSQQRASAKRSRQHGEQQTGSRDGASSRSTARPESAGLALTGVLCRSCVTTTQIRQAIVECNLSMSWHLASAGLAGRQRLHAWMLHVVFEHDACLQLPTKH